MKHYSKAELRDKVDSLSKQIAHDLIDKGKLFGDGNVLEALRAIANPPDREPNELEEDILHWFGTHEQEHATFELAVKRDIFDMIPVTTIVEVTPAPQETKSAKKKSKSKKKGAKSKEKKTRKPQQRKKISNFDNVNNGVCPHCQKKTLGDDVAGKGDGVTRTCTECQHKWYLNRKIRTCKCLTCPRKEK